ncbi:17385_t:CDS:2 [Racocetra fulgida]|uniref:17385_t:CDS:1 n=1 Tax=Racocetra fulgida TaxID=60492 RepID=A0A9N9F3A4_9GLOM|nr:17385_t:CDS:2 [Racocetra fulgida]
MPHISKRRQQINQLPRKRGHFASQEEQYKVTDVQVESILEENENINAQEKDVKENNVLSDTTLSNMLASTVASSNKLLNDKTEASSNVLLDVSAEASSNTLLDVSAEAPSNTLLDASAETLSNTLLDTSAELFTTGRS